MGFWGKVKDFFVDETEEMRGVTDDDMFFRSLHTMWQYQQALETVARVVATSLASCEWKVYSNNSNKGLNQKEKEDERRGIYHQLNTAFNDNETSNDCWAKISHKLVFEGECLIVQVKHKLYVADSFDFLEEEKIFLPNAFRNVKIKGKLLNRTFRQGGSAIYISLPFSQEREELKNSISATYDDALKLARRGAGKAIGMKLNLELNATNQVKYSKETLENISNSYKKALETDNAIVVTYSGEKLYDLTEKQRGSEVQQVLEFTDNLKKIEENILHNVARAFGFPVGFLKGEFTEDSSDVYSMAITFGVKPITQTLSKALTLFFFSREEYLQGDKIFADVGKIRFVEAIGKASAIDKLISCGAYTINEVREKLGDDAVEGGDKRYITKNYSEYGKEE